MYISLVNHSHYSVLEGYGTVQEYIAKAKQLGMPALGLTDKGTAMGLFTFIKECNKNDVTPLPGLELFVRDEEDNEIYNLHLLATSNKGMRSITKLVSLSWLEENYNVKQERPTVLLQDLIDYQEGLIVLSGNQDSQISTYITNEKYDKAIEIASRLKDVFKDNFYIELAIGTKNNLNKLVELAEELNIKTVITPGVYYTEKDEWEQHEVFLAINSKSKMEETPQRLGGKRKSLDSTSHWFMSEEEIRETVRQFNIPEEAYSNTFEIYEKIKNGNIRFINNPQLRPHVEVPEKYDSEFDYFKGLVKEGFLKKRGIASKDVQKESLKRIAYETDVLKSGNFISYFLTTADLVKESHREGHNTGLGRGCFLPGNNVRMTRGIDRAIEDIKVGDSVLTHDTKLHKVLNTMKYYIEEECIKITLSNGKKITCTTDHKIFKKDFGFIEAKDLLIGDTLLGAKNNREYVKFDIFTENDLEELNESPHYEFTIKSIEFFDYKGYVYDIEVEDVHNYTIEGITVHNSAGGSEIAYLLDIHETDPIKFDLMFDRFLSKGRFSIAKLTFDDGTEEEHMISDIIDGKYVHQIEKGDKLYNGSKTVTNYEIVHVGSSPDVDTDYHTQIRDDIINYSKEKYGVDKAANIITFNTMLAKGAFRDIAARYGIYPSDYNNISKAIPDSYRDPLSTLLDENNSDGEELRAALNRVREKYINNALTDNEKKAVQEKFDKIVKFTDNLHNRIKSVGAHPAGVIISSVDLSEVVPVRTDPKDFKHVIEWEYPDCEYLGLIKWDFLGLNTINIIEGAIDNVNENYNVKLDMKDIIDNKLNDPKAINVFKTAQTETIFQYSGGGVKELLSNLRPDNFDEVAAVTAIFRPGPMSIGYHTSFVNRKNGTEELIPLHKEFEGTVIEEILEPTLNQLIYQEQVLQIAQRAAGFTATEADKFRRAIGKKDAEVMASMKIKFIEGIKNNLHVSDDALTTLWDGILGFSAYAFNKSHSISYALTAYVSAWLKAYYPAEYMASAIEAVSYNPKSFKPYISEAKRMGLEVLVPDINLGKVGATATKEGKILIGLCNIKGINTGQVKAILKERQKNGLFKDIYDFIERCHSIVSQGNLEKLIQAGALDSLGYTRKGLILTLPELYKAVDSKDKISNSLFSLFEDANNDILRSVTISQDEYPYVEKLGYEAELLSNYLSGQPLSKVLTKTIQEQAYQNFKVYAPEKTFKTHCIVTEFKKVKSGAYYIEFTDGVNTFRSFTDDNVTQLIDNSLKKKNKNNLDLYQGTLLSTNRLDLKVNNAYTFTLRNRSYNKNYYNKNSNEVQMVYRFDIINIEELYLDLLGNPIDIYTVTDDNYEEFIQMCDSMKNGAKRIGYKIEIPEQNIFLVKQYTTVDSVLYNREYSRDLSSKFGHYHVLDNYD